MGQVVDEAVVGAEQQQRVSLTGGVFEDGRVDFAVPVKVEVQRGPGGTGAALDADDDVGAVAFAGVAVLGEYRDPAAVAPGGAAVALADISAGTLPQFDQPLVAQIVQTAGGGAAREVEFIAQPPQRRQPGAGRIVAGGDHRFKMIGQGLKQIFGLEFHVFHLLS